MYQKKKKKKSRVANICIMRERKRQFHTILLTAFASPIQQYGVEVATSDEGDGYNEVGLSYRRKNNSSFYIFVFHTSLSSLLKHDLAWLAIFFSFIFGSFGLWGL